MRVDTPLRLAILFMCMSDTNILESRGRVVTRWPSSQEVGSSILAATKIVRCKNLAFNIGECVSRGSDTT